MSFNLNNYPPFTPPPEGGLKQLSWGDILSFGFDIDAVGVFSDVCGVRGAMFPAV